MQLTQPHTRCRLEGMECYPKNMMELEQRFSLTEECRKYLFSLRWPNGYVCSNCGGSESWEMSNGLILCADCRYQQSVIAGTIFQNTHMPLPMWFRAMWCVCSQKNGVSALGLQQALSFSSYNTAWLCLHKLRKAMVRPGREKLSGHVEVDEAYIGGKQEGKRGRGAYGKKIIFVAVEKKGDAMGRIRLFCIPDVSAKTLEKVIHDTIKEGSSIYTDGWKGYSGLRKSGYIHTVTNKSTEEFSEEILPKCHLVISLVKRWILGTLQGNVGADHFQDYLNEFTFRFNRRSSNSRGKLFYRLAQLSVVTLPSERSKIVNH